MRIALLALLALWLPAFAQDDELPPDDAANEPGAAEKKKAEAEAEEDARALLAAALRTYKTEEHVFASATVKHKRKQQGIAGAVVIRSSMGETSEPYEGEVEAWRGPDGVTVLVSKDPLPGFALYVGRDRTVKELTFEDDKPGLSQLKAELEPLLDTSRFVRKVFDVDLARTVDPETGDITFSGEVPREIVKVTMPGGGLMFPGATAKVLKTTARLVVGKEGRFKSIAVDVTRNDPMAEAMRGRGGFRVVVKNGQPVPQKQKADEEKHDIEGGTTTYTIRFDRDGPSDRAKEFKKRVSALLDR